MERELDGYSSLFVLVTYYTAICAGASQVAWMADERTTGLSTVALSGLPGVAALTVYIGKPIVRLRRLTAPEWRLIMAQAYIFLAPGYEEVEMLTVVDMLRRAKIEIEMVSIADQREVTSSHHVTITADKLLSEADFTSAQMLILPGGIPGTPNLRACESLCRQLQAFGADAQKWVAAVCAAPTVLGELGILEGCRATCYPSFADQLICGQYVKQPVVRDGHVITSRGMGTCIEFAAEIITALKDCDTAEQVKSAIIYQDDYEAV